MNYSKVSKKYNRATSSMKRIILNSIGIFIYSIIYTLRTFNIYFFRYPNAFGHQTMNVEYFARKIKAISKINNPILIGIRHHEKTRNISNNSLFEHHKRAGIKIINNKLLCLLLDIGLYFQKEQIEKKGGRKSTSFLTLTMAQYTTDPYVHILSNVALPFDAHESSELNNVLKKMCLKSGEYYIVLDRGKDYDKEKEKYSGNKIGYIYKNEHSSIKIQFKAATVMKTHGISAVRMGYSPKKEPVRNKIIIDYPSKYRNSIGDIADLALMNGCKFYVGPFSGVCAFAVSLKKPILLCNAFPWPWSTVPMGDTSIVMPKKLWLIKEKRMMTLQEMIGLEGHYSSKELTYSKEIFDSLSVELISNTEDEIVGAVEEINNRIDGNWNGENYSLSSILSGCIGESSQSYLSTFFAENNPDIMANIQPDRR